MRNTSPAEPRSPARRSLLGLALASGLGATATMTTTAAKAGAQSTTPTPSAGTSAMTTTTAPLTPRQLAIGPIAAATAVGDMPKLNAALERGLDAGLTVNEVKEVLVQLYAYAGFPRSLNALGECMKVLDTRRKRGVDDPEGKAPGPVPPVGQILDVGAANQTKLSGAPVRGPLFDFAPAIDQFLKSHLFGDIFVRDNLDWQSRELATVAALSAMTGVESQLLSHVRISMNVGLTGGQLGELAEELAVRHDGEAGKRARAALVKFAEQAAKG